MPIYKTSKQKHLGPKIWKLFEEGKTYKEIAHETGAAIDFIGDFVRANKAEMNAPRNQPRKRVFNLERQLKKITLPMPEAFMEPLKEILAAEWSVRYLRGMNVPSSVASGLLLKYDKLEIKSEPVLEAHGKKLKPETLLLEDEFKNILKAALAYQVYLYASFPGIPPDRVEHITYLMFEGDPAKIEIIKRELKYEPWVSQKNFNDWKQFLKHVGGSNV